MTEEHWQLSRSTATAARTSRSMRGRQGRGSPRSIRVHTIDARARGRPSWQLLIHALVLDPWQPLADERAADLPGPRRIHAGGVFRADQWRSALEPGGLLGRRTFLSARCQLGALEAASA